MITNARGELTEIKGAGVIGKQPFLKPGESYAYTSSAHLNTPSGLMGGSYQMENDRVSSLILRYRRFHWIARIKADYRIRDSSFAFCLRSSVKKIAGWATRPSGRALQSSNLPMGFDLVIKTDDLHFSSSGQTRCAMARFCTPCWHCGQAGSTGL
jgi:hypothetical protein